eukprot:2078639-Prymnesium_polylepis.1
MHPPPCASSPGGGRRLDARPTRRDGQANARAAAVAAVPFTRLVHARRVAHAIVKVGLRVTRRAALLSGRQRLAARRARPPKGEAALGVGRVGPE